MFNMNKICLLVILILMFAVNMGFAKEEKYDAKAEWAVDRKNFSTDVPITISPSSAPVEIDLKDCKFDKILFDITAYGNIKIIIRNVTHNCYYSVAIYDKDSKKGVNLRGRSNHKKVFQFSYKFKGEYTVSVGSMGRQIYQLSGSKRKNSKRKK